MIDAALKLFKVFQAVKQKLYLYERLVKRTEFFTKTYDFVLKTLEDLFKLVKESEQQQILDLGQYIANLNQRLEKFLEAEHNNEKQFSAKAMNFGKKLINVATVDSQIALLQDDLSKIQQALLTLNNTLLKKIMEETKHIRNDLKDLKQDVVDVGKKERDREMEKIEKQFNDKEALKIWLEMFGTSTEVSLSLFFNRFYQFLVEKQKITNIKDEKCVGLVLKSYLDQDENKIILCSEFNAFMKDIWATNKAGLIREMVSVSKDDVKAAKLASAKGFGFNTRPILDRMPTLVLKIEKRISRGLRKDKNDFQKCDEIKIFANGKTDPKSKADSADPNTSLFGRLYLKGLKDGLPRTLDFSLSLKCSEISRHQFSITKQLNINPEGKLQFRYVFRDIANTQCDYLKVESKPYLLAEDMDFSIGGNFCLRIKFVSPRNPFTMDSQKYYNPLCYKEEQLRMNKDYTNQVKSVENFIKSNQAPPRIIIQVNPFFQDKLQNAPDESCLYIFQINDKSENNEFIIGSESECAIQTNTNNVAPKHCKIGFSWEFQAWYIQDTSQDQQNEEFTYGTYFCLSNLEYEQIYQECIRDQKEKETLELQELIEKLKKDKEALLSTDSQIQKEQDNFKFDQPVLPEKIENANQIAPAPKEEKELTKEEKNQLKKIEDQILQNQHKLKQIEENNEQIDPKKFPVILEEGMVIQVLHELIEDGEQLDPWRFRVAYEEPEKFEIIMQNQQK